MRLIVKNIKEANIKNYNITIKIKKRNFIMSYNKTTWQTGDVITAEKLNNIEEGIENNRSLILNIIPGEKEDTIIDCPIKNILDAFNAGTPIYIIEEIK